jgi:hypothetical protein
MAGFNARSKPSWTLSDAQGASAHLDDMFVTLRGEPYLL